MRAQTQPGDSFRVSASGVRRALSSGLALSPRDLCAFRPCRARLVLSEGHLRTDQTVSGQVTREEGILSCDGVQAPSRLPSSLWRCRGGTFQPPFPRCLQMPHCPSSTSPPKSHPHSPVLFWPRGAVVGTRHFHQGCRKTLARGSVVIVVSFALLQTTQKLKTVLG